jgi:hypothetical protein
MKQGWTDALENDYSESSDETLKEKNDKAYTYLVLACDGKPFKAVTCKGNMKNGYKRGKALSVKYNAQDTSDYVELTNDYAAHHDLRVIMRTLKNGFNSWKSYPMK